MLSWKDILRPVSALLVLQPFILLWLIALYDNPLEHYFMTAWGLQIYITMILIPYYAFYEHLWAKNDLD